MTKQWTEQDSKNFRDVLECYAEEYPHLVRKETKYIYPIARRMCSETFKKFLYFRRDYRTTDALACATTNSICIHCKKHFARIHLCPGCTNIAEARWQSNEMKQLRRIATCRSLYGVDNVMEVPEYKEAIKEHFRRRYGVENAMHVPEFAKKARDNSFPTRQTAKFKRRLSKIRRDPAMIKRVNEAIVKTSLERYGVTNPMKSPEVKKHHRKRVYEAIYEMGREEFTRRVRKTIRKNYGVNNPGQAPIVKERIKATMLYRYGVEHALQVPEFKEKALTKALSSSLKTKYKVIGGKKFAYLGYELPAIKQCIRKFGINNVRTGKKVKPIELGYRSQVYFPDIQIRDKGFIEVKSTWTFFKSKTNFVELVRKAKALEDKGYPVQWLICSKYSVLYALPRKWYAGYKSAKECAMSLAEHIGERSLYFISKWGKYE